jgi:hypothetical protein
MGLRITVADKVLDDFDPNDLTFDQAEAIEAAYGGTLRQWGEAITAGSMTALKILAWHVLRLDDPSLRLGDVKLRLGDVKADLVEATPSVAADPLLPTSAAADATDSPSADAATSPTSPTS